MDRIVTREDVIKTPRSKRTQGSNSSFRHSRGNGNPSVVRRSRSTKSGRQAPALRGGVCRPGLLSLGKSERLSAMKIGVPLIRHSRGNGNPSVLRRSRIAKSGGQAPALRGGVSRPGEPSRGRIERLSTMKVGAPLIRHSRGNGNPSVLRRSRKTKSGGQAPALRGGVCRSGAPSLGRSYRHSAMKIGAPLIRHSRGNGNPSVVRHPRKTKSRGQAPALRGGVCRSGAPSLGRSYRHSAMKIGAPLIRHSRGIGNPSVLRRLRNTKSGGQAPAPQDIWRRTRLTRTV